MTPTINAFLAIRAGSTRIPYKNFRLIGGKPLYQYLLDTALQLTDYFSLYLNTDHPAIVDLVQNRYGNKLSYYLRAPDLGTSEASLDAYAYDFMKKTPGDYTIFLNPCSLFLKSDTIKKAIEHTITRGLDSCTASAEIQTHCFINNQPMNFSFEVAQPRSQDLQAVHAMTSGFFIWKNSTFIQNFESHGFANFCGKFESFAISALEAIDIDYEDDIQIASALLSKEDGPAKYCPEATPLIENGLFRPN